MDLTELLSIAAGYLGWRAAQTAATDYAHTRVKPLFGPPATRAPVRVLRCQKRQKELLDQVTSGQQLPAYVPKMPAQHPKAQLPKDFDWQVCECHGKAAHQDMSAPTAR